MTEQCLLPVDRQSECKNHMASHVSERKIADALIEWFASPASWSYFCPINVALKPIAYEEKRVAKYI